MESKLPKCECELSISDYFMESNNIDKIISLLELLKENEYTDVYLSNYDADIVAYKRKKKE